MNESSVQSEHPYRGKMFSVRVDRVMRGGRERRMEVVEHGGSYGIIAATADGGLVLVRQERYAAGRRLWEIPAGTAERGETPLAGAQRELAEETGFRATAWRALGTIFMTPGICDEVMHYFLAEQLQAGRQSPDEDEDIEHASFHLDAAERMVSAGEIADAKTILAILWLRSSRYQLGPGTTDT